MSADPHVLASSSHWRAVLQALLVTFLWSTSWVLIKFGLKDIPALTFAGLRYMLAVLCLLPLAWRGGHLRTLRRLPCRAWLDLFALGLFFYAVTQGTQFLALERLPAVTTSLLLSFTAATVALLGWWLLGERLTRAQWGGIALYLGGVLLYFYPALIPTGQAVGLGFALAGMLANSYSAVLGRAINRAGTLPPLAVTVASMGIGAPLMLGGGIAAQGLPPLTLQNWAIIAWLAVINTALAFTLWNHTQRTLSAVESSLINNTMLIQIAALAWIFLGEALSLRDIVGLAVAAIGVAVVQLWRSA